MATQDLDPAFDADLALLKSLFPNKIEAYLKDYLSSFEGIQNRVEQISNILLDSVDDYEPEFIQVINNRSLICSPAKITSRKRDASVLAQQGEELLSTGLHVAEPGPSGPKISKHDKREIKSTPPLAASSSGSCIPKAKSSEIRSTQSQAIVTKHQNANLKPVLDALQEVMKSIPDANANVAFSHLYAEWPWHPTAEQHIIQKIISKLNPHPSAGATQSPNQYQPQYPRNVTNPHQNAASVMKVAASKVMSNLNPHSAYTAKASPSHASRSINQGVPYFCFSGPAQTRWSFPPTQQLDSNHLASKIREASEAICKQSESLVTLQKSMVKQSANQAAVFQNVTNSFLNPLQTTNIHAPHQAKHSLTPHQHTKWNQVSNHSRPVVKSSTNNHVAHQLQNNITNHINQGITSLSGAPAPQPVRNSSSVLSVTKSAMSNASSSSIPHVSTANKQTLNSSAPNEEDKFYNWYWHKPTNGAGHPVSNKFDDWSNQKLEQMYQFVYNGSQQSDKSCKILLQRQGKIEKFTVSFSFKPMCMVDSTMNRFILQRIGTLKVWNHKDDASKR